MSEQRDLHSAEFSSSPPVVKPAQTYAKGDRVRILATGALATVTYAINTHRGHWVTIRQDGAKTPRQLQAREIAKIEALF